MRFCYAIVRFDLRNFSNWPLRPRCQHLRSGTPCRHLTPWRTSGARIKPTDEKIRQGEHFNIDCLASPV